MPEGSPTRVFISYRHDDMDDATDRLKLALNDHFGEGNVFTDVDDLAPGDDFGEMIVEYIAGCNVLLAVIGRGWVNARDDEDQRRLEDPDDWVRVEIEIALERNIRVVPVLMYGAKIPKKQELPESLWPMLRKTGIEVPREWFDPAVQKLIKAIEKPAARPTPQAAPPAEEPPEPPKPDGPTIFINYRREDSSAAAILVHDRLAARFGSENLFLDAEMPADSPAIFLALIGRDWLQALKPRQEPAIAELTEDYVRKEIELALRRGSGLMVIPVLIDDATPPLTDELPRSLQPLTQLQMERIRFASFDEDVGRLADRIEALAREAPSPSAVRKAPATVVDLAPPPDERHFNQVQRYLSRGSLVSFLGSGITGSDIGENSRPTNHAAVAAALAARFDIKEADRPLAEVTQEIETLHGAALLQRAITSLLTDVSPGPVQRFFASLPARLEGLSLPRKYPLVLTTNYDTALERAFEEQNEPYDLLVYMGSGEHRGRFAHFPHDRDALLINEPSMYLGIPISDDGELERSVIVKACGSADRAHQTFVITTDDFVEYLSGDQIADLIPAQLLYALRSDHCLFLGYSTREPALRVLLNRIWRGDGLPERSWAVAREMTRTDAYFWQRSGIDAFAADPHEYVVRLQAALVLEPDASRVE